MLFLPNHLLGPDQLLLFFLNIGDSFEDALLLPLSFLILLHRSLLLPLDQSFMRESLSLLLLTWDHKMIDELLWHIVNIVAISRFFLGTLDSEALNPIVLHQVYRDVECLRRNIQ